MLIARDRARAKPSLRFRLARHVLLLLALTWGLGSIVVLTVAKHFAAQAFDRSLLDDAYALAAHVRIDGNRLALDLTPQEMSTLLFDQSESIYFAVFGPAKNHTMKPTTGSTITSNVQSTLACVLALL